MSSTVNQGPSAAPAKPWENTQQQQQPAVARPHDKFLASSSVRPAPSTAATLAPIAGSTLGVTSPYGPTGYGAGLGSTYGTGFHGGYGGGMNTYGGGYAGAMNSYGGGYAGGMNSFGTGLLGGGSSYGGYGGMSRGGYGGGMGGGTMDPNGGGLSWLSSLNQIVSSIGQITELLGMNAEALNFCIGSSVHFLERMGAMCTGIAAMLAPRPVFPPGHPRHGEPPVTEEEERSRRRRVRIFQFMLSMATIALLYKGLRWLRARTSLKKLLVAPPSSRVNQDLEHIFQRTVGVRRF